MNNSKLIYLKNFCFKDAVKIEQHEINEESIWKYVTLKKDKKADS